MDTNNLALKTNKTSETMDDNSQVQLQNIDAVVIGAGAAGLAVALSLIEQRDVHSIVMIEKEWVKWDLGLGLAYSPIADVGISNRRNSAMSMVHGNPSHFEEWRREYGEDGKGDDYYSDRMVYGRYLRDLFSGLNAKAKKFSVDFKVIRSEAIDLDYHSEVTNTPYRVTLRNGFRIDAKGVVLALGNFLAMKQGHLSNASGYSTSPWPLQKLNDIPIDASVGIVGTNSSAIDAVTTLYERHHKGSICMMSRGGSVPRVEGHSRAFPQTYILHIMARELENKKISLEQFLKRFEDMLLRYDDVDINHPDIDVSTERNDIIRRIIINDMSHSVEDGVRMQHVLDAFKPIAERVWNFAKSSGRVPVLQDHPAWKTVCQETMSTYHAMVLLDFTKRENFKIIQDNGVGLKGDNYFLMGRKNRVRVDYVIEATGLEHNPEVLSYESPILKQMLQKDLVEPDGFGGVNVGFKDHQASPGLYVIGSLTKGTHCFVEDIERIVSHASRISRNWLGRASKPLHVALFVDRDLFSTMIMMDIVPQLLATGHMPFVFLLEATGGSMYVQGEEREYHFFENLMIPQVIIPNYKSYGGKPQIALATDSIENEYGILVQEVKDANDPAFLSTLNQYDIDLGYLIGSKPEAVKGVRGTCLLSHLKPGAYPDYHDIHRVMEEGEQFFGYSLHFLGREPKYGCVAGSRRRSVLGDPCALTAMLDNLDLGSGLVVDMVHAFSRNKSAMTTPRTLWNHWDKTDTPPSKLVDLPSVISRIVAYFATTETREHLLREIRECLVCWGIESLNMGELCNLERSDQL